MRPARRAFDASLQLSLDFGPSQPALARAPDAQTREDLPARRIEPAPFLLAPHGHATHVRFWRVSAWPQGAPSPADLERPARDLAACVVRLWSRPCELVVNANSRVSISAIRQDGRILLRLHWALLSERGAVEDSLRSLRATGRFGRAFGEALERATARIPYATRPARRTPPRPSVWFDLPALLANVRAHLPDPNAALDISIRWGARSPRRRARSQLRLGAWIPPDREIVVHPVLDDRHVPPAVIARIVYHELCHAVAPPLSSELASRTRDHRIHHREFRALEARFPDPGPADRWLDDHIAWLLRHAP